MKGRTIIVNKQSWKYKIGRGTVVARNMKTRLTKYIDFSDLTGMNWTDIERASYRRYFHITPKAIALWLAK